MFDIEKSKEPPIERESRVTSDSNLAYIMNLADITTWHTIFLKRSKNSTYIACRGLIFMMDLTEGTKLTAETGLTEKTDLTEETKLTERFLKKNRTQLILHVEG